MPRLAPSLAACLLLAAPAVAPVVVSANEPVAAADAAGALAVSARRAADGSLYALVRNRSNHPLTGIVIVSAVVDDSGAVVQGPAEINLRRQVLQPGQSTTVNLALGHWPSVGVLPYVRFEVQSARPFAPAAPVTRVVNAAR